MQALFEGLTILVCGSMVGNEFAVAAFAHPVLWRLADSTHTAVAGALARVLGRAMPFWYALGLLLMAASVGVVREETGRWPEWMVGAAVVWLLVIVWTLVALVPINNRVGAWKDGGNLALWKRDRQRWDGMHRWRVVALAVSFGMFLVGVLGRG